MPTFACHVCPGLATLAARADFERIVISARNSSTGWEWTVDLITNDRDGHATASTLDAALNQAVSEIL